MSSFEARLTALVRCPARTSSDNDKAVTQG